MCLRLHGGLWACEMALNFKLKLSMLVDENARLELLSPFFCETGDTYAELHLRLEKGGCVDLPFQFWDFDDHCRIRQKFEPMNPVFDQVYVIPEAEEEGGRVSKRIWLTIFAKTGSNDFMPLPKSEFAVVDVEHLSGNVIPPLQEAEATLGFEEPEVVELEENFS